MLKLLKYTTDEKEEIKLWKEETITNQKQTY